MHLSSDPAVAVKQLIAAYNKDDNDYAFNGFLYNKPTQNANVNQYTRNPNVKHHLWEQATRQNPDPTNLTPCFLKGFDDLKTRAEGLRKLTATVNSKEHEMQHKIQQMKIKHESTKKEIEDIKKDQLLLTLKVFQAVRQVIAKNGSNSRPLTHNELLLQKRLKRIKKDLDRRTSKFTSKCNEIMSTARTQKSSNNNIKNHNLFMDKREITEILRGQQQLVADLVDHVKTDEKELIKVREDKRQAQINNS